MEGAHSQEELIEDDQAYDDDYEPTTEEITGYAHFLGM